MRRRVFAHPAVPAASVVVILLSAGCTLPTIEPDPATELTALPWEGGPSYYAQFPTARSQGWTNPQFFPVGVWYQSVTTQGDIDRDKHVGINTYVMLTDDSDHQLIRANHMSAVVSPSQADQAPVLGTILADEVDMKAGRGNDSTAPGLLDSESPCTNPGPPACGFSVMDQLRQSAPRDLPTYANYGKGVNFWLPDEDAATFVNGWTDLAVSSDVYWYTDGNVCVDEHEGATIGSGGDRCRRAANYGLTIDRMRKLDAMDSRLQPIWALVEVGHPSEDSGDPTITGEQIEGAVMNSLIHGARGIVYFEHSFGGSCVSFAVLRDTCGDPVRANVTSMNRKVADLARVLNTPSLEWTVNTSLDTMLKRGNEGSFYLFTMLDRDAEPGTRELRLPSTVKADHAQVLFEDRSVPIHDGKIIDSLDSESAYHIYKVPSHR